MNKTQRYILISAGTLLLVSAAVLFWVYKYKPFEDRSTDNDVNAVINNIDNQDDNTNLPPLDTNEITEDTQTETPTETKDNTKAEEEITDTLNSIQQQMDGLDSNSDFADFGTIE